MSIEPKDDFVEIAEQRTQTVTDLERARHLIAKGWCQETARERSFFLGRMRFCTTAAIGEATGNTDLDRVEPAINAMFATLFPGCESLAWFDRIRCLQRWNDHGERTKHEVLAAFDKAIASVRATV